MNAHLQDPKRPIEDDLEYDEWPDTWEDTRNSDWEMPYSYPGEYEDPDGKWD